MRLIDADKLILDSAVGFAMAFPKFDKSTITIMQKIHHVFQENILKSPTIEAEPVRHGKWLLDGCCEIQCSCCDETYSDEIFMMRGGINYCPNCGAKMDGGNENA